MGFTAHHIKQLRYINIKVKEEYKLEIKKIVLLQKFRLFNNRCE